MTMPEQKPGRSKQDYGTPRDFLDRVLLRFGAIHFDLAAHEGNHVVPWWYGPGGEREDSLATPWPIEGTLWLNPPFSNIEPWAKKCAESVRSPGNRSTILFLVPASIGSNWFAEHVFEKAIVIALQGRLSFDGKAPYPKDCMLCVYIGQDFGRLKSPTPFEVWNWRKK